MYKVSQQRAILGKYTTIKNIHKVCAFSSSVYYHAVKQYSNTCPCYIIYFLPSVPSNAL